MSEKYTFPLGALAPALLRARGSDGWRIDPLLTPASADGILFRCPQCTRDKGATRGVHSVICWTPKVEAGREPGPGRWTMSGTGFSDLTLSAASSSIQLHGGCNAHFFVRNGQVTEA